MPSTARLFQSQFVHDFTFDRFFLVELAKIGSVFQLFQLFHFVQIVSVFIGQHGRTRKTTNWNNHGIYNPHTIFNFIFFTQFLFKTPIIDAKKISCRALFTPTNRMLEGDSDYELSDLRISDAPIYSILFSRKKSRNLFFCGLHFTPGRFP